MPFVKGLKNGGWCRDRTHAARRLTRFSGPGHYCSANHPKWIFAITHCVNHKFKVALAEGVSPSSSMLEASRSMIELREQMAAQAGIAPAPSRLTGGWTTIIRPGNELVSAAGLAPAIPRF